jgi:hypothetical protein
MLLRLSTILGISMAGLGLLGLLSVVVEAVHGQTPDGWASLMVVTLLLSGVQLIILGVLGEYLGRLFLFLTINAKPQFMIRDLTRKRFRLAGWKAVVMRCQQVDSNQWAHTVSTVHSSERCRARNGPFTVPGRVAEEVTGPFPSP